jgi:hypothetical protein
MLFLLTIMVDEGVTVAAAAADPATATVRRLVATTLMVRFIYGLSLSAFRLSASASEGRHSMPPRRPRTIGDGQSCA